MCATYCEIAPGCQDDVGYKPTHDGSNVNMNLIHTQYYIIREGEGFWAF